MSEPTIANGTLLCNTIKVQHRDELETFYCSGTHQNLLVFCDSLLVLVLIHRRLENLDLMVMNVVQDLPSIKDLAS